MIKTMPYSLYKTGYTMFKSANYNARKKTIDVELPEYVKPRFPSDWEKCGNHYKTPNGCRVYFWNSGLSENFVVEHSEGCNHESRTFPASLYVREAVINYVSKF